MPRKPWFAPGAVVALPFEPGRVAAGIIVALPPAFLPRTRLLGMYDAVFPAIDRVDIDILGGPFIATPQLVHMRVFRHEWPMIGRSDALLQQARMPLLRMVGDLYRGDTFVRKLAAAELHEYASFAVQFPGFVMFALQKHFLIDYKEFADAIRREYAASDGFLRRLQRGIFDPAGSDRLAAILQVVPPASEFRPYHARFAELIRHVPQAMRWGRHHVEREGGDVGALEAAILRTEQIVQGLVRHA